MDTQLLWGLIRVGLALVVIVPLTIWATRWYGRKQGGGQDLRIKEALSLGTNRALYVVIWEDRQLLLGVTGQNITVLGERSLQKTDQQEVAE
ncbi:MAG: flagellar biosynthetic protein FliO [Firmicutes bacterium]|nr:flagellar biosynthetic protein FliO [Bacillota bacterium]